MCKVVWCLVLNCWRSSHVHPQYLYSFSFFKLSVGVDTWWVTWKLCLQKKKWRQRPQHQGTLEKCFHKPIWRFLCFSKPTFPPQPSQKNDFFFLLSFFFFKISTLLWPNWICALNLVNGNVPSVFCTSPLEKKITRARSVFTYWMQMKNSAWFSHKCSKNVIKHFSAGDHLSFNAEPLTSKAGTLTGIEEHLLVFI